jgi:plasmid rolling circle replication initiator protein Rep
LKSLELAESYKRIGNKNKWIRVSDCSCQLVFKVNKLTGRKKLKEMKSCQVRLCSMCNWRRSRKIFGQVSKVMNRALEDKEYRFIFLTLTCENVYGEELSETIDSLFKGFKRLSERKQFEKAVKGWFRALEITHDVEEYITDDMWYGSKHRHIKPRGNYYESLGLVIGDKNPNFDKFHPHFHIIQMVNKSYFKDDTLYMTQESWTNIWKECLDINYTPIVNVKAFRVANRTQTTKSVTESAKYTVKDGDYLVPKNKELTDKTVSILDTSLANRRLIAYGGELRKIHKELNLDDAETGDLVNTDNDDEEFMEDVDCILEVYNWHVGYRQYYKHEF